MKRKGFTLVELVIVIIIVGILSLVAVPIYRKYVMHAKMTEAKTFLRSVYDVQRVYHLEHGVYYYEADDSGFTYNTALGIDARQYKYFTAFSVALGSDGWEHIVVRAFSKDRIDPTVGTIRMYWWADPSKEGTPVPSTGIIGALGKIPPFFAYYNNDENKAYLLQS